MMESFYEAQKDYTKNLALALVSQIVELVLPEREATDPVFRLILVAAREIAAGKGIWLPLAYFALWSTRLAGWLPSFERCQNCGKEYGGRSAWVMQSGEFVCPDCRIGGRQVSPAILQLGRRMLTEKLEVLAQNPPGNFELKILLEDMLDIIEREADHKLSIRAMLPSEQI
jgi:recombinational DNA repair protein (RecF pathway)